MPKIINFNSVTWFGRLTENHDNSRKKKYFCLSLNKIYRFLVGEKDFFNQNNVMA